MRLAGSLAHLVGVEQVAWCLAALQQTHCHLNSNEMFYVHFTNSSNNAIPEKGNTTIQFRGNFSVNAQVPVLYILVETGKDSFNMFSISDFNNVICV